MRGIHSMSDTYKLTKLDTNPNPEQITLDSWDDLNTYVANQVAEFVRDNMFELKDHPMDYQDHFTYIIKVYAKWLDEQGKDVS